MEHGADFCHLPAVTQEKCWSLSRTELERRAGGLQLRPDGPLQAVEEAGRAEVRRPLSDTRLRGQINRERPDFVGRQIDDQPFRDDQYTLRRLAHSRKCLATG